MPQAQDITREELGGKLDESLIGLEAAPVNIRTESRPRAFNFLFQRVTYYWITLLFNLYQLVFCSVGFALAVTQDEFSYNGKERGYSGGVFMVGGMYSILLFIFSGPTLWFHYKKGGDTGRKAYNAGAHYKFTLCAALINATVVYMLLLLGPTFSSKVAPCSDLIRPILYHFMIGVTVLSVFSNLIASRITIKSAKRARGTELVVDPNYRVPAWTLATTEESQDLFRAAIRL